MMLGRLVPMDEALEGEDFKADEVPYNLLHLIGAAPEMPSFKSSDGRMIFARSARGNAWLWMQDDVSAEVRERWLLRNIGFTSCGTIADWVFSGGEQPK